jgi:uncharacterized protein YprB with RNaseH-like and TPR domain
MAKILVYDIEVAPMIVATFGRYEADAIWTEQEQYILSIAYKWHGERGTKVLSLPQYPRFKKDRRDDTDMLKEFYDVVIKADMLLGHNIDRFDTRLIQGFFLKSGLPPTPKIPSIDTLKIARKHFKLPSNRLDDIGEYLGIGRKIKTDWSLWKSCMEGDEKAFKKMERYNRQDVILTERVFDIISPWGVKQNIAFIGGETTGCPHCGSKDLQSRGFSFTKTAKKRRFQCKGCGSWSQSRKSEKTHPELTL